MSDLLVVGTSLAAQVAGLLIVIELEETELVTRLRNCSLLLIISILILVVIRLGRGLLLALRVQLRDEHGEDDNEREDCNSVLKNAVRG